MTQAVNQDSRRLEDWIARVQALVDQIAQWSAAEGWEVQKEEKQIREEALGDYQVPMLHIRSVPGGEVVLEPIALEVLGGDGRVDLEAYPTLARVKFVGVPGGWRIMTDSNVPLRQPWEPQTFVQLVRDLLS